MIRILHPWLLLFLLAIPVIWVMAKRIRVLGRGRKTLALILRSIVFILLVLALAEVQFYRQGDKLTVFFVIDRSSSIPSDEQRFSLAYVQERLGIKPEGDQSRILFFGKDAAIQENPREDVQLLEYETMINPDGTDIESAIGLAMAAFPEGTQKRIVLITDANETQGNAEAAVQRAKASGIDVRVLPLEYSYTQDALIEDIIHPTYIKENEPFNVKVIVSSQEAGPAKLRLTENGEVVAEEDVQLQPGKNAFTIPRKIELGGFYQFEASVEAKNDRRPANNRAQSFSIIQGTPRILLLDSEQGEGQYLAAALVSEGIDVQYHTPEFLPSTLQELQTYDCIILSNVNASSISPSQQEIVELGVRDLGIGLIMIGGPESFGSGGYLGTPIERALPVTMDVKQQRMIPSGALAMIMHSMEIPQGNHWAREVSLAALDVLSRDDYMGFLFYNSMGGGDDWLFPLEKVGDKTKPRTLLLNLAQNAIGDMPSFVSTMRLAHQALKKVSANKKHMVILSDGDPQRPLPADIQAIRDDKITISTVCISPHNQTNVDVMRAIAELGGGKGYYVTDNRTLPKIFIKEASVVRKNLVVEEEFIPQIVFPTEIIEGFTEGFPPLNGYVVTTARPEAQLVLQTHKEDPLLAHWRYGLGKSVAFTSDAKSRWAPSWMKWDRYAKFWAQVVRWAIRSQSEQNYQVTSQVEGDKIRVMIDALTPEGGFVNNLDFAATAIDPNNEASDLDIVQTQPGRYEATFPVTGPGSYMVSMNYKDENGTPSRLTSGVSVPFSPEHNTTRHNATMLKRIAELSGRPELKPEDDVFIHDMPPAGESQPLWPYFLGFAIAFFFFDIAARRLYFELTQVQRFLQRMWDWLWWPFRRQTAPLGPATEQLGKLMEAKARVSQPDEKAREQKESFIQKLEATDEDEIEDVQTETAKDQPAWREVKKGQEAPTFQDEQPESFTSALMKAKKRAEDEMKKKK